MNPTETSHSPPTKAQTVSPPHHTPPEKHQPMENTETREENQLKIPTPQGAEDSKTESTAGEPKTDKFSCSSNTQKVETQENERIQLKRPPLVLPLPFALGNNSDSSWTCSDDSEVSSVGIVMTTKEQREEIETDEVRSCTKEEYLEALRRRTFGDLELPGLLPSRPGQRRRLD